MSKTTLKQRRRLLNEIAKSDIDRNQLETLLESDCLAKFLQEFITKYYAGFSSHNLVVKVNYENSWGGMIWQGEYDRVNSIITQEHFLDVLRVVEEVELHLVDFGRSISLKEVVAALDKKGMRPATLPELCALGASYPELQREFDIVALGSEWCTTPVMDPELQQELDILMPGMKWRKLFNVHYLSGFCDQRELDVCMMSFSSGWLHDNCRFAAVSK